MFKYLSNLYLGINLAAKYACKKPNFVFSPIIVIFNVLYTMNDLSDLKGILNIVDIWNNVYLDV